MSYDLFAQRFRNGVPDPSPPAGQAVLGVLRPFMLGEPDAFGVVRIRTPGGDGADFYLRGADSGFMVNHFEPAAMDLIVRAATAGGMVIHGPELPPMLTDPAQLEDLPALMLERLDRPVLISTGSELAAVIQEDQEAISSFRDRIPRA